VKAYSETGLGQQSKESRYRFNWNAPIHVSVHDPKVIYHGANVLLRSSDRGFSWEEASPDLTRNEEDKQGKGAGPYTNENIEQYNTIFSFAESPHDPATLWVGSDDGLVHVTRDGGENWSEVTPRGVDRGLINSIDVSPHDPATAYITVMKYKTGDNQPYAYRTTNYGRTWTRISDELPQEHFVRVVREDTERPGLLFAGMERGLFVSFNGGGDWQSLQLNLPVVPITDLMLRQKDLVLATQGRAFWVVDDIAPLRQYEPSQEEAPTLYTPTYAIRLTPTKGRSSGGESVAPSAPDGVVVYYSLPEELDLEEDSVTLEVLDAGGETIRAFSTNADAGIEGGTVKGVPALPAEKGINRFVWDLRTAPTTRLDYDVVYGSGESKAISGWHVKPGTYSLRLTAGEETLETSVAVSWDPINSYGANAIGEQQAFVAEVHGMIDAIYTRIASLQSIEKQVRLRKELAEAEDETSVLEAADALLDALETWQKSVTTPDRETFQDVLNFHPRVDAFLIDLFQQADKAVLGLTKGQRDRLADLKPDWQAAMDAWNTLIEKDVKAFNERSGPAVVAPAW
jgi:hypothetical protein